jgi:Transglutaminase-like superfamily
MKRTVLECWLLLLYFEWLVRFESFAEVYQAVRQTPVSTVSSMQTVASSDLCRAMDIASVLYFNRVRCLQRTAATTVLLRRHGWKAEMVIGAQVLPFKSHSWCELDDVVVNDRPYMLDIYTVLERC